MVITLKVNHNVSIQICFLLCEDKDRAKFNKSKHLKLQLNMKRPQNHSIMYYIMQISNDNSNAWSHAYTIN